mgnify:CR=1 FL=1
MAEKSKTMVEPASQESKITSEPKTATQLKPDNTQTSTNVNTHFQSSFFPLEN